MVQITSNNSQMPSAVEPEKLSGNSCNHRFEAVEKKLNGLLDSTGGIPKGKYASTGYLKLLLLTATSGDEAIQSNRDLSMILDAFLKTKSRAVLTEIVIKKNGLKMLQNIIKKYRSDFKKTPILRKVLKVLEYLANREIITEERINGRESFRESMLSLTEHEDKEVHQMARNFRDKWFRKPVRKHGYSYREKDWSLSCKRVSTSVHHWHEHEHDATDADAVCSSLSSTNSGKRKSRWDQPAEDKVVCRPTKKLACTSLPVGYCS